MLKQDGKLFGKINIIDLLAIVAIVVLIAGVAIRFMGDQPITVSDGKQMECTVLVRGVRKATLEALQQGGSVYDVDTKEYIGEIVDIRESQNYTMLSMENGEKKLTPTEGRYNVEVVISYAGSVSDEGYYTESNHQMAVGSALGMRTKYIQCWGGIESIRLVEE